MTIVSKPAFQLGFGMIIFVGAASVTAAILQFKPSLLDGFRVTHTVAKESTVCNTIATDPSPPLNVRSSPVVAPDNVVGTVRNGTRLVVVDQNEGWLRVTQPIEGWVYQDLTVTSCISATTVAQTAPNDEGMSVLAEATEQYQAGNLAAAIALAKTIPASSAAHQPAKGAITQWQRDWKTAETQLHAAQKAMSESRWQDVLNKVSTFPENRFWRTKLTPIVKTAIQHQNAHPIPAKNSK